MLKELFSFGLVFVRPERANLSRFPLLLPLQAIDGTLSGAAETRTTRQVFKEMVKSTVSRSKSYAKGFGAMGALFAGSECLIEKSRAKHDSYNSVYAGCATGAILAHSGGPKAMCIGCASFAAFSALIDRFLEH